MIKRNAGQGSRFKAAFVRHFFNFDIWEQTAFAKCSAAKHLSDQRAKTCSRVTGKTALFEIYARKRQTLLRAHAPFPDVFLNMNFLLSYQAIIMHT